MGACLDSVVDGAIPVPIREGILLSESIERSALLAWVEERQDCNYDKVKIELR